MSPRPLLSSKKQARIRRDEKIRAEQERLFREPGAIITTVNELLMKKYKLSRSTIRTICQAQEQGSVGYSTGAVGMHPKPPFAGGSEYK